jgi:hypothetical protein
MLWSEKRVIGVVLASALIVIGVGNWVAEMRSGVLKNAIEDVNEARLAANEAIGMAGSALMVVREQAATIDSLEAAGAAHAAQAKVAVKRETELRQVYDSVSAMAPDTCAPVIAAADSALAVAGSAVEALTAAYVDASAANDSLHVANDELRGALIETQHSLSVLNEASGKLVRAAHPSLFSHILPRAGLGVAVGLSPAGVPGIVFGVTLGWHR